MFAENAPGVGIGKHVSPKKRRDCCRSVSQGESDNRYIECAVAGGADYLVTGDKVHLIPIGEYEGIKFVSPATFLALLQLGR